MTAHQASLRVRSSGAVSLENITSQVADVVAKSGVRTGIVNVHLPHTTAALVVNEDEAGLRQDILRMVEGLVEPFRGRGFLHDRIDHNAKSHVTSVALGNSLTLPVSQGRPALGTWENIFLVEMDGPRSRTVHVTVVGEA
jgi:secondary thiamine-phosphate synthase enzyme